MVHFSKEDSVQLSMDVVCGLIVCYQLAAAEAEAESLRRELAGRRGDKNVDLSKLKPPIPEQRIDGIGYRETIFSATGKDMGNHI